MIAAYNTGDVITGYGGGIQRLAGDLGGGTEHIRIRNNYDDHMYHAGAGMEIFDEQGRAAAGDGRAVCGQALLSVCFRPDLFQLRPGGESGTQACGLPL